MKTNFLLVYSLSQKQKKMKGNIQISYVGQKESPVVLVFGVLYEFG